MTDKKTDKKTVLQQAAAFEKKLASLRERESKAVEGAADKAKARYAKKRAALIASVPAEVSRLVGE